MGRIVVGLGDIGDVGDIGFSGLRSDSGLVEIWVLGFDPFSFLDFGCVELDFVGLGSVCFIFFGLTTLFSDLDTLSFPCFEARCRRESRR